MGVWEYHVSTAATILVMLVCWCGIAKVQSQTVSALFVFGDSLVDVGNNNYLRTLARANFPPYGVDFAAGATGRFSNGKTLIDFLGEMVGVPSPPAFADLSSVGDKIRGVNYASAASGILDDSGRNYGEQYSMNQQLLNFEKTLTQYRTMMNEDALNQFLAKSIAVVVTGNNDYINNYLRDNNYNQTYPPQEFGNLLINNLERQVSTLHSLGLRKFFLPGIGPIGCIPYIRARHLDVPEGRCVDSVNQVIGPFNEGLKSMVDRLNKNFPDAKFAYGNTYHVLGDILNNPGTFGFRFTNTSCCGVGIFGGFLSCLPYEFPCVNRHEFVFWDAFHPTETAIYVFAYRAVHGSTDDSYPINFQQMAQM